MAYLQYKLADVIVSSYSFLPTPEDLARLAESQIQVLSLTSVQIVAPAGINGAPAFAIRIDGTSSGFAFPPGDTVTSITVSYDDPATPSVIDFVPFATMTGLSVPTGDLLDALRDADVPTLETLLLGGADSVSGSEGNDPIHAGAGADTVRAGGGDDTASGGSGNDRVFGGTGNDVLYGDHPFAAGIGNDLIYGEDGNDTAFGGAGRDQLFGGAGNDLLFGGSNNDILQGDVGADTLVGGTGADIFRFRRFTDSLENPVFRDVVQDFRRDEGDRIDLSLMDGNTVLAGAQLLVAGNFIGTNAFGTNTPGQIRWETSGGNVTLQVNTDNDSAAEFVLTIRGITSFSAADFHGF